MGVGIMRLELFNFGKEFLGSSGSDMDFGSVGESA
jgi:hypothetical protein